jgi:hypothetical protein
MQQFAGNPKSNYQHNSQAAPAANFNNFKTACMTTTAGCSLGVSSRTHLYVTQWKLPSG